ncbi:MAG: endonuclease/exonuclease/phosphatase family protein, partial [Bacteroidales bacterium]|nr:endonuclease/exonuclease/phosphatase family protein [Bacteroidales bacterium]
IKFDCSYGGVYQCAPSSEGGGEELSNDSWGEERSSAIVKMILDNNIDIIGIQEGRLNQLDDISAKLSKKNYNCCAGKPAGVNACLWSNQYAAIFYRSDKFSIKRSGTFWFSETSNSPGGDAWGYDKNAPKICSWIELKDKTGFTFFVFNAHFPHDNDVAKIESANLLKSKIETIAGKSPVMAIGDFNSSQNSQPYNSITTLLEDCYRTSPNGIEYTYCWWDPRNENGGTTRIDHLFVSNAFSCIDYTISSNVYTNKFGNIRNASDHHPVIVKLNY